MDEKLKLAAQAILDGMIENLRILEIRTPEPVVMACLAIAEMPLEHGEIMRRTGLSEQEIGKAVASLGEKGHIRSAGLEGKPDCFEISSDMDEAVQSLIQTRGEAISRNLDATVKKADMLLSDSTNERDMAARLYARILGRHLKRMEFLNRLIFRRMSMLDLLNGSTASPPRKVTIE